jgi:hypothetical protein
VENVLSRLLSQRLAAHAIAEVLDQAMPLDMNHAKALRLLWRARHLLSVCQESMVENESWTVDISPFNEYDGYFEKNDSPEPQNSIASLKWTPSAMAEVISTSNKDGTRVVDGPGLHGLMAATSGVRARIYGGQMRLNTVRTWRTGEPSPESTGNHITWLVLESALLDLRTGLLVRDFYEEAGDMAMAVCHGQPAPTPDTPNPTC